MPQKNTIKVYVAHSYYHIYARGINKQNIFLEDADYRYFTSLFQRYLSKEEVISKTGVLYPNYRENIRLLSFCFMTNHIHLLLYQADDPQAIRKFMSSVMTSYSKYFNLKYRHYGSVFESRYKAKRIDNDSYLTHITRYIHMNPRRWQSYKHSSLPLLFNPKCPKWLATKELTGEFKDKEDYITFLLEYQENKDALEQIKHQLADK